MAGRERFNENVALPPGLTIAAIKKSIPYVERACSELVEIYFEQANVFSALVGIFGVKALDTFSVFEKSKHRDEAQTRFPDLCRRGRAGRLIPDTCLESKGSKRPWAIQSHYDHPGWYIVWRYTIDPTKTIDPGKSVIIWRADVTRLEKRDWKYEGSKAGKKGGGRTHTFGLRSPSEHLEGRAVFERLDFRIQDGKPVFVNGN